MVRYLRNGEIPFINRLAMQAEPLFGKMAGEKDFEDAVRSCAEESSILCYTENDQILGAIILNRQENEIAWLVVEQSMRGKGIGKALLNQAILELDNARDISVQTFASSETAGAAARKLYETAGFIEERDGGPNPAGIPTVFMKLKSCK